MEYHHIKNSSEITLNNTKTVKFDFPILKILPVDNVLLILLEILGTQYNQNVYSINIHGDIIWQIERCKELDEIGQCPFTNMEIRDSNLSLYNFCGYRFTVDISTGKILDYFFVK